MMNKSYLSKIIALDTHFDLDLKYKWIIKKEMKIQKTNIQIFLLVFSKIIYQLASPKGK